MAVRRNLRGRQSALLYLLSQRHQASQVANVDKQTRLSKFSGSGRMHTHNGIHIKDQHSKEEDHSAMILLELEDDPGNKGFCKIVLQEFLVPWKQEGI